MKFCGECGQGNQDDVGFCVQCGFPLAEERLCGKCGSANQDDAVFCARCGVTLETEGGAALESPGAAASPPGGMVPPTPPQGQAVPVPPPVPPPGAPYAPVVTRGVGPTPPPGVQFPPPPMAPIARALPNEAMAIAAFVLGIAGFMICPLILGVAAIIVGYMARNNIQASQGTLGGDGFATAGIILGWVNIGLTVLFVIIAVIAYSVW